MEEFSCAFLRFWAAGYIKYIYCFTGSGPFLALLVSFKSSKIYLLGSIFSSLVGLAVMEQLNCGFLMPCAGGYIKYIYCFTNSWSFLAFLGPYKSCKLYVLESIFTLLMLNCVESLWSNSSVGF